METKFLTDVRAADASESMPPPLPPPLPPPIPPLTAPVVQRFHRFPRWRMFSDR